MGIRAYLRGRLYGSHTIQTPPIPQPKKPGSELRTALLRCATLTPEEVDEYIAYKYENIFCEDVPLDCELEHPDEELDLGGLYANGILQTKFRFRHMNQISSETLEKVKRVLPLIYYP